MIEEWGEKCPVPKVNKLLVLLLFVFLLEAVYIVYIKEEADKEYDLLIQLKSLNLIYQKIDFVFDKKNTHQSFDEIVRNIQQFNAVLEKIHLLTSLYDVTRNREFSDLYHDLQHDYQYSQEYVERYKSWDSLTVNSIRLIFDVHEHLQKLINENVSADQRNIFIREIGDIVRMTALLSYDGLSDAELIRRKMKFIKGLVSSNAVLSKQMTQLDKHFEILFEGYEVMELLKEENKLLNISQTIERLRNILLKDFKSQDKENYINIYVSNALIIVLFMILFITNRKESKLHYKICKMNYVLEDNVNELESVNDSMRKLMDKLDKNVITSKTDKKGVITYASEAFCKISGYTRDELIGRPHNIVRHPDMPKEAYKEIWSVIQSGKEWNGEIKNATKSKGYYWVDVTISPEFNEAGEITGYSAIRHDITAKKELEVLSRSLEDQVKFRTQELEEMVNKVEMLSITDELTQLYNRRYYTQIMDTEIKRAERNKNCFNYVLIDIDNFKRYNDTYGHQSGDVVLKEVSNALILECKRPNDFIFRMGGEEFVVIFTSDNKEQAIAFSQKIIQVIAALKIEHLKNPPFNVLTVSGGLVSYNTQDHNMDEGLLYKKADKLLYQAKEEGRNNIKF